MSVDPKIRVRFAPSPTGDPHVGNVRTALFNYLFAKHNGGVFIVRLEDTDKAREVVGSEDKIRQGLEWLGLKPDESPWHGGEFGPYRQSERLELYKKHADQLIQSDHAYYCFCTSERLEQMRADQNAKHLPPRYDRLCRSISKDEASVRIKSAAHVIRLKVPDGQKISWRDLIKGDVVFQSDEIDDQVLLKSDSFPTYHLANVVDDYLMKISHVLRGEDWLSSTPKHLILYQAFGWKPPQFGHTPLILGPDKAKLSKRNGNTSLLHYKADLGVHSMAMNHFMATLGWTAKEAKKLYTLPTLANDFSLDRVGTSPSIFDLDRLNSLSKDYYDQESDEQIYQDFKQWTGQFSAGEETIKAFQRIDSTDQVYAKAVVGVVRLRGDNLNNMLVGVDQFFSESVKSHALNEKILTMEGKVSKSDALKALEVVKEGVKLIAEKHLPALATDRITYLADYFRKLQPSDLSGQAYLHPTRVAITRLKESMNMFEYLSAYLLKKDGKQEIIRRLEQAISIISN